MLRAMRDSNLPKFLRDDILLFRAIIKDLFPGVQEPNVTYDALEKCLDEVIDAAGLQKPKDFTIKCIQLYEMTVVRHGMMLVGPTGGGKTRVLRSLQAAMSKVQDDPAFDKVRVYRLNPKSITMNQLYGSFDLPDRRVDRRHWRRPDPPHLPAEYGGDGCHSGEYQMDGL